MTTGCVPKLEPAIAPTGCVVTASLAGPESTTVKEPELAVVRALSAKWRVLLPLVSMRRLVKVAMPALAAIEVVPWRVPVPVLMVAVTVELSLVTVLP